MAYQTLLLDEPMPDYSKSFPAFVHSGLTFLTEKCIEGIAFSNLEKRRLEALRKRMFTYRMQLKWPINKVTRQQFIRIFKMLVSFVEVHPEFYYPVRAELASWILHKSDPDLAKAAERYFIELYQNFENKLATETPKYTTAEWEHRLVFEDGMTKSEIKRIKKVMIGTTFLKQSIILAFDERTFNLEDVPEGGIWISRIQSLHNNLHYRLNVTTHAGKHFDLQLILRENLRAASVVESMHWIVAVAGYPYGAPVLSRLGCYRPELGARSMVYLSELTVWEKIQQFSAGRIPGEIVGNANAWRKLFIEALAVFYRGWHNSGNRIVTGAVSPNNIVVPELDFQEGATILSLTGWYEYKNTLSLIKPMLQNFYRKTTAHYPWCEEHLDVNWIFDACIEALGHDMASEFLSQLIIDLASEPVVSYDGRELSRIISDYVEDSIKKYYIPLPLHNALEKFAEWERVNPLATFSAREQTVIELYKLYDLDRFPEFVRYYLYRYTYFSNASRNILSAFDRLLNSMRENPRKQTTQFLELTDLQDAITNESDRKVFSHMIFPRSEKHQKLELEKREISETKQVIVNSFITDKHGVTYTFREPVEPSEIGQLYQLFYNENFPITGSETDKHYVLIDLQERVIAGIFYKLLENNIALLDKIIVSSPLKGRGIATAVIEEFCNHMASQKVNIIKAPFYLQQFYQKQGFIVDKRWGALVKFLAPEDSLNKMQDVEIDSSY